MRRLAAGALTAACGLGFAANGLLGCRGTSSRTSSRGSFQGQSNEVAPYSSFVDGHVGEAKSVERVVANFAQRSTERPEAALPKHVQSALFPNGILQSPACPFPPGALEAARDHGAVAPAVLGKRTGAFTAAGAHETAYLVHIGECNATHAEKFGSRRLIVFHDERITANGDVLFDTIEGALDLDGDGVSELLMTTGGLAQGIEVTHAVVVGLKGGTVRKREVFDEVVVDACSSDLPESTRKTARLVARTHGAVPPGAAANHEGVTLHAEYTESPCR